MNIKYCDLIAYSGLHTEFNAACLQVFMRAFNCEYVDFYAEHEHCGICQGKLNNSNIKFHRFELQNKKMVGGFKTLIRDIISCFYVVKIFAVSKRNDILFFALAYPFAQYAIWLCSFIFIRDIYLCQHGELEVFVNVNYFGRNTKYYSLVKPLLRTKRIKQIILGEPIWKNVKHLFNNKSKIIVIDHPCDFTQNNNPVEIVFKPLVIGQIGSGNIEKGTHYLFELSELLRNEISEGKLKIKLIGRLDTNLLHLDNHLVEYSNTLLDTEEFNEGIKNLHYTLQLRDGTMGKAVASGTFLDTIKYEKPFLALKNDYVSYYAKQSPQCGKIYNSVVEIANAIKRILETKEEKIISEYKTSVTALKQLQNDLSLAVIAEKLKKQL